MSEIKVRAWDEYTEYMFYSDKPEDDYFFAFNEQGVLRGFVIRPPRPSSDPMEPPEPYTDDYPVMLFIGLHGRNNVEIYEGDILKYYDASVPKGTNPQKSTTVCWSKGNAGFKGCFRGEVIGTIHDPEYMEQVKDGS